MLVSQIEVFVGPHGRLVHGFPLVYIAACVVDTAHNLVGKSQRIVLSVVSLLITSKELSYDCS